MDMIPQKNCLIRRQEISSEAISRPQTSYVVQFLENRIFSIVAMHTLCEIVIAEPLVHIVATYEGHMPPQLKTCSESAS